jgi:hypothetical protein
MFFSTPPLMHGDERRRREITEPTGRGREGDQLAADANAAIAAADGDQIGRVDEDLCRRRILTRRHLTKTRARTSATSDDDKIAHLPIPTSSVLTATGLIWRSNICYSHSQRAIARPI